MDRSLYIGMSGAKQTLLAQTANSNNLSNSQTTGFKADFEQFRAMPVFGPGFPTRAYAMTERPGTDWRQGPLQTTGREFDVAIKGPGWFAVQGQNGREAYTRAGDLQITPQGLLQTGAGLQLVNPAGNPITIPPYQKVEIGRDGTISIIPLGANAATLAVVDQIKLVNPPLDNLEKLTDGLMYTKDQAPVLPDANVTLAQGVLEGSNVNPVDALVEMIELARHYEMQVKVMKTADENGAAASKLVNMA